MAAGRMAEANAFHQKNLETVSLRFPFDSPKTYQQYLHKYGCRVRETSDD